MILRWPTLPTALRIAAFALVGAVLIGMPLAAAGSSPPRLAVRWGDDGQTTTTASPVQVALAVLLVWAIVGAVCLGRALRGDRLAASLAGAAAGAFLVVVEGVTVLLNVGSPDASQVTFGGGDVIFLVSAGACAAGIAAGLALMFERWAIGSEHLAEDPRVGEGRARLRHPIRG